MTVVAVPGSKSVTARALFLAAAAEGTTTLRRPLLSDDTDGFAEGLLRLGYRVDRGPDVWRVEGRPAGPAVPEADLHCRDAATAARFLPALAAAGHGSYRFDASAQMRRRPVAPLTTALRTLGVDLRHEEAEGHLPLTVTADGIEGGALDLDASRPGRDRLPRRPPHRDELRRRRAPHGGGDLRRARLCEEDLPRIPRGVRRAPRGVGHVVAAERTGPPS